MAGVIAASFVSNTFMQPHKPIWLVLAAINLISLGFYAIIIRRMMQRPTIDKKIRKDQRRKLEAVFSNTNPDESLMERQ